MGAIHHSRTRGPCDRSCGEADLVIEAPSAFYANTLALIVFCKQQEASRAPSSPARQGAAASSFAFYPSSLIIYRKIFRLVKYNLLLHADSLSFLLPAPSSSAHGSNCRTMCSAEHLFMPEKNYLLVWCVSFNMMEITFIVRVRCNIWAVYKSA